MDLKLKKERETDRVSYSKVLERKFKYNLTYPILQDLNSKYDHKHKLPTNSMK